MSYYSGLAVSTASLGSRITSPAVTSGSTSVSATATTSTPANSQAVGNGNGLTTPSKIGVGVGVGVGVPLLLLGAFLLWRRGKKRRAVDVPSEKGASESSASAQPTTMDRKNAAELSNTDAEMAEMPNSKVSPHELPSNQRGPSELEGR